MSNELELLNSDMSKKEALTYIMNHLEQISNEISEIHSNKHDWNDGFNRGCDHICYEVMKLIDGG